MSENKQAPVALKPVTVQKVSAILRKAGFTASTSEPTRVKGWRNYTSGYEVCVKWDPVDYTKRVGAVVTYRGGDHFGRQTGSTADDMLSAYAKALEAAGVTVERQDNKLICTGIKEE